MRKFSEKLASLLDDDQLTNSVYQDWIRNYSKSAIAKKYDIQPYAVDRIVEFKRNQERKPMKNYENSNTDNR